SEAEVSFIPRSFRADNQTTLATSRGAHAARESVRYGGDSARHRSRALGTAEPLHPSPGENSGERTALRSSNGGVAPSLRAIRPSGPAAPPGLPIVNPPGQPIGLRRRA